ncbi:MAG: DUF2721 domain-containing protein [Chitinophagaceae bacterium]|nr:MAG: DUF2721 domain-containing protein [Chitinophagaceae bacterium]
MELSITTPALLFPAISLMMLAYTNRFLALASLIRNLHAQYKKEPAEKHLVQQIRNLRTRIRLIRSMQGFGVLSFLFCIICMFTIFNRWETVSYIIFAASLLSFGISLVFSLTEIFLSMRALEVELGDLEDLSKSSFLKDIIKETRK